MSFQTPKLINFFTEKRTFLNINTFYQFIGIFILFLTSFGLHAQSQKPQFILTLDAGHGGHDNGAAYYGNREKDVALAIVQKLGKKIEKEQKDVKVIYTRQDDSYPELYRRAEIANSNKSNLFISVHCNSSKTSGGSAVGTETWVLGAQNDKKKNDNFDVVAKENAVIFLEKNYKENYDGYDPSSPESVIGMTLMQDKFLENSLRFAQIMEETFQQKESRPSRGVKQGPFLVLVKTAMPAVLIETGFINHPEESFYLASEDGQNKIVESIYATFTKYKKEYYKKSGINTDKPVIIEEEKPVANTEFKVLFLNSNFRYPANAVQFRGLKEVEVIKVKDKYYYYAGKTSFKKQSEKSLKDIKDSGFKDAKLVEFNTNKPLSDGNYRIELFVIKDKLRPTDSELKGLVNVERIKTDNRMFQYLYGNYSTLEQANKALAEVKKIGFSEAILIKN